jgi:hypothetical protein
MADTCQWLIGMPIETTRVGIPAARNNCMPFTTSFYPAPAPADSPRLAARTPQHPAI